LENVTTNWVCQWGYPEMVMFHIWLVVSNMAFIFHNIWDNPSHWLSYFSRWLKPPTRHQFLGGNSWKFVSWTSDWDGLWGAEGQSHCRVHQAIGKSLGQFFVWILGPPFSPWEHIWLL
jgi:hypothetical protein